RSGQNQAIQPGQPPGHRGRHAAGGSLLRGASSEMIGHTIPILMLAALALAAQTDRPRARDLGLSPGVFPPGPLDAITDVAGVRVGHVTLIEGDSIRTGVTAILPTGGNLFQEKVPGA